jgi:UDP-N-acetylglucosamine 2-epimerase (non-hydrolysing)
MTRKLIRCAVILGTRPEAIKLAPVVIAFKAHEEFQCDVIATAQHREMLDQVLSVFDIVPDVDLDLMRRDQTLAELTSRSLDALDRCFASRRPDVVLCQGDTTTVLAGALAAFYHGIPLGHVEAGLRTWNLQSPWPEEANRVLTSRLATIHFAPTELNRQNLLAEGVPSQKIVITGNTVIDALLHAVAKIHLSPPAISGLDSAIMNCNRSVPVVLITGHRRENFGEKLESICLAISDLAQQFPGTQFIYPVHMNPAVRQCVENVLGSRIRKRQLLNNVHLIDPLSYFQFVSLMERSMLIITDSGGIQEEAPSLHKPVLVTRETTERPEALAGGFARIVGSNRARIVAEVTRLLTDADYYQSAVTGENPYGDGKSAARIVDAISNFVGLKGTSAQLQYVAESKLMKQRDSASYAANS